MKFLEGIIPREYQQKIFEKCIKKNCLVILPTGLGKTLIALMLSIKRIESFPKEKIIFLAPTKPLVEQHLNYFKKHLPELFAEMILFTGQINSKERQKLWKIADVIFSTPQCIANDLKKNLYDLKKVCLLIEDEAHRCIRNYDYNYIAKQYIKQADHSRILGLTASPGSSHEKIKEICKNLSIEEVELRTRNSHDVEQYLQELKFEKISVDFPPELEELKQILLNLFKKYTDELKKRKVLWEPPSKINLIKLQKKIFGTLSRGNKNFNYMIGASICAQAIKIQHALELLETQTLMSFNNYLKNLLDQAKQKKSKGVIKLVAKPEFNFVFTRSNELLIKNIEHPKIQKLIEIVKKEKLNNHKIKIIIFTQFRNTAVAISNKLNEIEGIKSKVFVGQAKKNNTGLSQKEQKQIIKQFSSGEINVLCATCIAEEGLDIPEVNAVIFYESVPSAIRKIQRSGRTARLMKGKLIMLIAKKTRDEAFYYIANAKEKKMQKSIKKIKEEITNGIKYDFQKKLE